MLREYDHIFLPHDLDDDAVLCIRRSGGGGDVKHLAEAENNY